MTPSESLTKLVIVLTVLFLVIYDVWVCYHGPHSATISNVLVAATRDNPVIAFAMGFLMAHFFWRW